MSKTIRIKSLELVNFKGIRDLKVEFGEKTTNISGRNGSGKTTLFDAFTYVLFGKDSRDRTAFNIKTLDENNKPIPRLPHEVTCVLVVDGEEVELCRRYNEKWTKKRGSAYEEFTGHEEERFYNGVPCSVKEYASKVSAICDEAVFKFITNPLHFTAQRTDIQREMLFRMAGGISDGEVAKGNSDFLALLDKLTGKTLDEYRREVAVKMKRIKEAVEGIPTRIDERKRDYYEEENWTELEAQITEARVQLAEADKQMADISEAYRAMDRKKGELWNELGRVRSSKMERRRVVEEKMLKDYNAALKELSEAKARLDYISRQKVSVRAEIEAAQAELVRLNETRAALLTEWRKIKAETLTFSEDEFVCPTCGRKYEMDEIEARQMELSEKFQQRKSARLERNKNEGLLNNKRIEEQNERIANATARLSELEAEEEELSKSPIFSRQPERPDTESVLASDKTIIELTNKETDLQHQIDSLGGEAPDTSEIQERKKSLLDSIGTMEKRLAHRDANKRNAERIAELEDEMQAQSQALADLEAIEYTITQFAKAKVEHIEKRVNALFKVVRFKMFNQQLNGGETPTCEAMVNGVPYSDLNNAGRINAGLDIINAICNFEGVYAPIFIDNAESVNELMPTTSQTIRLIVTEDENLVIE
ncbi:MAG: AAA family ATPase [Bacteroidales bacterium]|nr:AAA family ATPase [Bacteroidales bacterium]